MTNPLQAALIQLAEKAGMELRDTEHGGQLWRDPKGTRAPLPIPGGYTHGQSRPVGTLSDAEVTVVLGWLAKAGYKWGNPDYENHAFTIRIEWFDEDPLMGRRKYRWQTGHGDTLNEALAEAVKALHEAKR